MSLHRDTVSTLWWLLFIVVTAIMAAVFLYPRYQKKSGKYAELKQRQTVLEEKQKEREKLIRDVRDLETSPEAVSKVAREKFGMSRSGETILVYRQEPERQEK